MGFIFNNLNVFSQELAGRQRLGITTAVIQSTRMVGGMFGTALVGMFVTRAYVHHVSSAAVALSPGLPDWLLRKMEDPQILVNRHGEDLFLAQLNHAVANGPALLEGARKVLTTSIHLGFALTALAALCAVWQVRAISHMRFRRVAPVPELEEELSLSS
jgi:hypothetical protein